MTSSHPQVEILYCRDFKVYITWSGWNPATLVVNGGEGERLEALTVSVLNDLEQMISHPAWPVTTTIPTLIALLTPNPTCWNYTVSLPKLVHLATLF